MGGSEVAIFLKQLTGERKNPDTVESSKASGSQTRLCKTSRNRDVPEREICGGDGGGSRAETFWRGRMAGALGVSVHVNYGQRSMCLSRAAPA